MHLEIVFQTKVSIAKVRWLVVDLSWPLGFLEQGDVTFPFPENERLSRLLPLACIPGIYTINIETQQAGPVDRSCFQVVSLCLFLILLIDDWAIKISVVSIETPTRISFRVKRSTATIPDVLSDREDREDSVCVLIRRVLTPVHYYRGILYCIVLYGIIMMLGVLQYSMYYWRCTVL